MMPEKLKDYIGNLKKYAKNTDNNADNNANNIPPYGGDQTDVTEEFFSLDEAGRTAFLKECYNILSPVEEHLYEMHKFINLSPIGVLMLADNPFIHSPLAAVILLKYALPDNWILGPNICKQCSWFIGRKGNIYRHFDGKDYEIRVGQVKGKSPKSMHINGYIVVKAI